jgi:hypothetical protein
VLKKCCSQTKNADKSKIMNSKSKIEKAGFIIIAMIGQGFVPG